MYEGENDSPGDDGLVEEETALRELALRLYNLIPDGFDRVEYSVSKTDPFSQSRLIFIGVDGSRDSIPGDREVSQLATALRKTMYRRPAGTWFSAEVVVTSAGEVDASYNYDDEPHWDFSPDPQIYTVDLDVFPRDEAHMPEWLRQKVRDHEAGKTE